jgi:hypothetical protein
MAINKSIKKRTAALSNNNDAKELRVLYEAALADLTAQRTAFVALTAKLDVLTAKLNADAGVTDVNYATNFASTLDPVALTLTA